MTSSRFQNIKAILPAHIKMQKNTTKHQWPGFFQGIDIDREVAPFFSSTNSKPYICWQHVKSKKEWMVALVERQRKLLWTFMLKTPTTHT